MGQHGMYYSLPPSLPNSFVLGWSTTSPCYAVLVGGRQVAYDSVLAFESYVHCDLYILRLGPHF